ncbi:MAG: tetratricopeptide repeat protein [Saprospiraceae bacterium]
MTQRLTYLHQLLATNPLEPFVLFAVAKEYEKMGDQAQALEYYQQLYRTNPTYVGLYYHLGKLHEQAGRLEAAVIIYQEGMEIARQAGDTHARNELAAAKLNLADDDE